MTKDTLTVLHFPDSESKAATWCDERALRSSGLGVQAVERQKEQAATRHKITEILVQDSADVVPSFTGCCSSVRLTPSGLLFHNNNY